MGSKKPDIQIPAWKRKYNEAYLAAGNKIPDAQTARAYNMAYAQKYKIPYGTVASHYNKMMKIWPPEPKEAAEEPSWKNRVTLDVESDVPLGGVINYTKRIATEFNANINTVTAFYYKQMKNKSKTAEASPVKPAKEEEPQETVLLVPEPDPIPDPIPEPEQEPISEKPKLHPGYTYRKGSIIRVKVRRVENAYAVVETLDEHKLTGIIHISQISNTFISDIFKWFRIGMELSAQVIDFMEIDGGRLTMSTRNLNFTSYAWKTKQPRADLQEQLNQVAEKLFKEQEKKPTEIGDEADMEQEWKQAKPFIEKMIGTISGPAEQEIRKLMRESGVFAFTMTLMQRKDNFTPDLGLLLAQTIRKDLTNVPTEKEFPR